MATSSGSSAWEKTAFKNSRTKAKSRSLNMKNYTQEALGTPF